MMQLKGDPELKPVFDEIEAHGAAAMERYWNDTDLMSKIAQKLAALNIGPATPPGPQDLPNLKVLHLPWSSAYASWSHPVLHAQKGLMLDARRTLYKTSPAEKRASHFLQFAKPRQRLRAGLPIWMAVSTLLRLVQPAQHCATHLKMKK